MGDVQPTKLLFFLGSHLRLKAYKKHDSKNDCIWNNRDYNHICLTTFSTRSELWQQLI